MGVGVERGKGLEKGGVKEEGVERGNKDLP